MHSPRPRYTGAYPMMPPPIWAARPPGHCGRCGEPSGACRCGCRECRKEAKELLAVPAAPQGRDVTVANTTGPADLSPVTLNPPTTRVQGFIGGGCCVSLSVEYAPQTPTTAFGVEVEVEDSEGTTLVWRRSETAGTGYRIKECIITTKPGAKLGLVASNCTARVRWCEVFSC